ncbi:FAD/NAD-P-binding domain-containing protein [Hymenopellis radicata]|nr:FAD/NAD-P-binding domain-containing protein [Hymenopellis radicata]
MASNTVGIIGSGAAGLITAHVLRQDGFNVQIISRDKTPGGVWSTKRVYKGLTINNVHGEFRFSPMPMPPPADSSKTGGRLQGEDMRDYMQAFSDRFLQNTIRYNTEVLQIERTDDELSPWSVTVRNTTTSSQEVLRFSRLVLCTGGCETPKIPSYLSQAAADYVGFKGLIIHSRNFAASLDDLLTAVQPISIKPENPHHVVVVGGGKSAQDAASFLANQGRKVTVVFHKANGFLAVSTPLPDFIRKSRFLSVMGPTIDLNTRLERFLHTTWLGSKFVHTFWRFLQNSSVRVLRSTTKLSLRRTHSLFWSVHTSDEGAKRDDSFYSLVNAGQIELISGKVTGYTPDGTGVALSNGSTLHADAIILATGYSSSWEGLFDEKTAEDLGITRHPPRKAPVANEWNYASLADPPPAHPQQEQWAASIYRGIVPAKGVLRKDFAINGAVFTTNNGYAYEVTAHWISAYFRNELQRAPASPEEATEEGDRTGRWMRKRFPDQLLWINESYSTGIEFFSWPQYVDKLLQDMGCRSLRSGGNWLTWPFKVIDLQEISDLKGERDSLREARLIDL